ncbi:MAG: hypothetical protein EAX87_03855 [Candidatus Thorarchaeota archaeon]|nr:hypothetical protein [Candidatus Thorarchaeota archaeon]
MEEYDRADIDWEISSVNPYSKERAELRMNADQIDFILPRRKRGRSYNVVFNVKWDEIISFDCSQIIYCKDELTWPAEEPLPKKYVEIGPAGIFFLFLRAGGEAFFQIWAIVPQSDIEKITEFAQEQLSRQNVPGLAHHGTTGVVNYILDRCEIIEKIPLHWHDWIRSGPSTKPREKFMEIDPELVICKEGMAFNFAGASSKLKQMSTFWPWRVIREIAPLKDEVPQIAYIWHEDNYTFTQQVWDDSERNEILMKVKTAHEEYQKDDSIKELRLIRPWSFPSVFHDTWDNLKPFVSKASRDGFPPIEEIIED